MCKMLNDNYTWCLRYNICSTWFLDISINLIHLTSKAQTIHNWCTALVASQNICTIPTGIHCQQLWNVIIIAVLVLYFWICHVHMYFWIYHGIFVIILCYWYYTARKIISLTIQMGIYPSFATRNSIWRWLTSRI